ncbi:MAG: hypothetical protein H6797_00905 [Candidatus Nomurabacteria bacterium]|nr:MAG: hypothetical protein H6797_00905 [Candidatus Nomurabacteria bacterium]
MIRKKAKTKTTRYKVKKVAHPIATKLKLLQHAHTGRIVHRHHTSYPVLLILLVITGFFVFVGYDISAADTNVTVGLTVPAEPPTEGAVITSPKNGTVSKKAIIDVKGTCSITSEVVVYSNNTLVGSTLCTTESTFQLKIQLFGGINKLTALNYNGMNQAGPITPSVKVIYVAPPNTGATEVPVYPIVVPGVTPTSPESCTQKATSDACNKTYVVSCNDYSSNKGIPVSKEVRAAIICLQRHVSTAGETIIGILVWGGSPPYAVTINWGDGSADLVKSISKPGYFTVSKKYTEKGQYTIEVQSFDSNGKQAFMQATIDVSGPEKPKDFIGYVGNSMNLSWFDSPVPTYFLAVAIVIGFWAGDYFERAILATRKVRGRRRHA